MLGAKLSGGLIYPYPFDDELNKNTEMLMMYPLVNVLIELLPQWTMICLLNHFSHPRPQLPLPFLFQHI
jgi:hypothetical protein